ncbi:MAG: hypothetical protein E5V93_08080 [Mesorhizobium sp.]|nr:MAG: hypothetical protein E5V93_08080 [Mesorhizobium sp.]
MLPVAFPNFVVRRKAQSARINDDDNAILQRWKAAALGKETTALLELNLTIHCMEHTIVRTLGLKPARQITLEADSSNSHFA